MVENIDVIICMYTAVLQNFNENQRFYSYIGRKDIFFLLKKPLAIKYNFNRV